MFAMTKGRSKAAVKKTNKLKDFPLGETSKKALKEYVLTLKPGEALFASRKGCGPITRQQAYRILNNAAGSIGIKEQIGTHSLRKTFGYHAFQAGEVAIDKNPRQRL